MRGIDQFRIEETRADGWIRLALTGELDLASAPLLRDRLQELKGAKQDVRLDLAKLGFIDSRGAHVLADAIAASRSDTWRVDIRPGPSRQVQRFREHARQTGWDLGF